MVAIDRGKRSLYPVRGSLVRTSSALLVLAALVLPAAAAAASYSIGLDGKVRDRDLTSRHLPALRAIFGTPTPVHERSPSQCTVRWKRLGVRVTLAAFGTTRSVCRNGEFWEARFTRTSWHTRYRIHPGAPAGRAKRHALRNCTRATCGFTGYVLSTHLSDCAGGRVPTVSAEVSRGRVTALRVATRACE
jgi:hypothetical protein